MYTCTLTPHACTSICTLVHVLGASIFLSAGVTNFLYIIFQEDGMRLDGSSKTLTVRDCFKEYCRKEVLDGDNKPVSDELVHTLYSRLGNFQ